MNLLPYHDISSSINIFLPLNVSGIKIIMFQLGGLSELACSIQIPGLWSSNFTYNRNYQAIN